MISLPADQRGRSVSERVRLCPHCQSFEWERARAGKLSGKRASKTYVQGALGPLCRLARCCGGKEGGGVVWVCGRSVTTGCIWLFQYSVTPSTRAAADDDDDRSRQQEEQQQQQQWAAAASKQATTPMRRYSCSGSGSGIILSRSVPSHTPYPLLVTPLGCAPSLSSPPFGPPPPFPKSGPTAHHSPPQPITAQPPCRPPPLCYSTCTPYLRISRPIPLFYTPAAVLAAAGCCCRWLLLLRTY